MTSMESPFFELRQALQNNPIVLGQDLNVNVMDKVGEGGWITVQTTELIAVSKHMGYCNFVYMKVNFL